MTGADLGNKSLLCYNRRINVLSGNETEEMN